MMHELMKMVVFLEVVMCCCYCWISIWAEGGGKVAEGVAVGLLLSKMQ